VKLLKIKDVKKQEFVMFVDKITHISKEMFCTKIHLECGLSVDTELTVEEVINELRKVEFDYQVDKALSK
jgi:hypothetical protein